MIYSATLSTSGQVTLPSALRKVLRIKAGERVDFVKKASGDVVVRRQPTVQESVLEAANDIIELNNSLSRAEKALVKKHAGKTASELRASDANNPQVKKYYKEKYAL